MYIACLTFFYFLPDIASAERDPRCKMNMSFSYGMFGWVILSIDAMISLIFIASYYCKLARDAPTSAVNEFMEKAVVNY